MVVDGVVSVVMVIVLDGFAASHTVTHIVVRPHVELVHRAPVLVHPRALSVEQRPAVSRSRSQGETGSLVAGVAWQHGGPWISVRETEFSSLIGRALTRLYSHWLIGIMMLLRQLTYAIKTQLKAPKALGRSAPYYGQWLCLYGIRVNSIQIKNLICHTDTG